MKKKSVLNKLTLFLLIGSLTFTGLGCKIEPKTIGNITNATALEGEFEVIYLEQYEEFLKRAKDSYKLKEEKVNIKSTKVNPEDLENIFIEKLASGVSLPDMFLVSGNEIGRMNEQSSSFMDLTSEIDGLKNKYVKAVAESYSKTQKNISLPFSTSPLVMIYNTELFGELKIKTEDIRTWQEYIEVGKKLTEKNKNIKFFGRVENEKDSFQIKLLNQLGYGKNDKDEPKGKYEASVKVNEVITSLKEADLIHTFKNDEDMLKAIEERKVASALISSNLLKKMEEKVSEGKRKWNVMSLPAFEPGGKNAILNSINYIYISKSVKNQDLPLQFSRFLVNNLELSENTLQNTGVFTLNQELYNSKILDKEEEYFGNKKIWRFIAEIVKEGI